MVFFSLQSFIFFLLSTSLCLYFNSLIKRSISNSNKNGFKTYPILGALPGFIKHRNRHLEWLNENIASCPTKTALFHRLGINRGVMTADPANVEHVLRSNFDSYPKGPRFIAILGDLFGRGLFVSNGDAWRVQRKALARAFHAGFVRHFVADKVVAAEVEARLVPLLDEASESGAVIDFQAIFQRFAFDTVCKMTFGADLGCLGGDSSEFMLAFDEASEIVAARLSCPFDFVWRAKRLFNLGSERRLREAIRAFHEQTDGFLLRRPSHGNEDLISQLVENGGEEDYSPEYLRDLVTGMILAGQDTTASALTWFFWILSSRADVEAKIMKEIEESRAKNGKSVGDAYGFDELRDMHYLHAAISETMRLYPPVPLNGRVCSEDHVLPDGTLVRKGWFLSYHAYTMGRMESIWGKDCLEFRPERWLDDGGVFRQESPFRYPVFNAGPRTCLGKDFAYVQMKFVAATVIERYVIVVQEKVQCPKHSLSFTLRMEDGLKVTVKKRDM